MDVSERIVILDFGSQYTQLIARRIRELGVFSEIHPYSTPLENLVALKPAGIILSGGPASVYMEDAPLPDRRIFELGKPILGICYGLQLIAYLFGGEVDRSVKREYGRAQLIIDDESDLFAGIGGDTSVWMSHADALIRMPDGFVRLAHTANSPIAALRDASRTIYGVQFHPEVVHTPRGKEVLANFLFRVCKCRGGWDARSLIERTIMNTQQMVGPDEHVLLALSGGVDSTVTAILLHKAIGDRLHPIHVDNGLMRRGESESVISLFREQFSIAIDFVDASQRFLDRLRGVLDPEEKRRRIGETFIEVFEERARKYPNVRYLAQGTLYPDVIESRSYKGPSATIKTHHNVGGLPEKMNLELIEPLRELFKDEVRAIGQELHIPESLLRRHPFPGPGLAVRVLGEVTPDRIEIVRATDAILIEELEKWNLYDKVWQAFAILLPVHSVGVMGDERTYNNVIALRAVTSLDGMTADWAALPDEFLAHVSNRIINEVPGVNRVVYDISSKPPATIEWE